MPFRAVIFDLDGTLLDTLEDIANAANRALTSRGLPPHPIDSYRQFIGDGVEQLITRVLPPNARTAEMVQACIGTYREEYAQNWHAKTRPYAGIPQLLDELTRRQLKLAALSNKPDEFTQQCVRVLLGSWKFDVVIGASDRFPKKPHPASALAISKELAVQPGECLYLGDSGVDMQTATAAGMFAAGVLWGFRGRDELLKHGAQVLVENPKQLLDLLEARGAVTD